MKLAPALVALFAAALLTGCGGGTFSRDSSSRAADATALALRQEAEQVQAMQSIREARGTERAIADFYANATTTARAANATATWIARPPTATATPLPATATATPEPTETMGPTWTPVPTWTATATHTPVPPTTTAQPSATPTPLPPVATAGPTGAKTWQSQVFGPLGLMTALLVMGLVVLIIATRYKVIYESNGGGE